MPAPRGMEDDDVAADASHSPAAAPSLAPTPPAPLALQFRETIVLPGDDVTEAVLAGAAASGGGGGLKLGAGLVARGDAVVVTKPGVLSFKPPARFYVAAAGRRYIPAVGDNVVGVVIDRNAEFYRVRLHGSCVAVLPALAFDGASKRNKPNLLVSFFVSRARVCVCVGRLRAAAALVARETSTLKRAQPVTFFSFSFPLSAGRLPSLCARGSLLQVLRR